MLTARAARTGLAAHYAAPHAIGYVRTRLVAHMSRKVHQVIKLGDLRILKLINIALKLGRDGRLDGHALPLGRRCHEVEMMWH